MPHAGATTGDNPEYDHIADIWAIAERKGKKERIWFKNNVNYILNWLQFFILFNVWLVEKKWKI